MTNGFLTRIQTEKRWLLLAIFFLFFKIYRDGIIRMSYTIPILRTLRFDNHSLHNFKNIPTMAPAASQNNGCSLANIFHCSSTKTVRHIRILE